jgi:uncharacterized repeat protein (TIGR03803 family)
MGIEISRLRQRESIVKMKPVWLTVSINRRNAAKQYLFGALRGPKITEGTMKNSLLRVAGVAALTVLPSLPALASSLTAIVDFHGTNGEGPKGSLLADGAGNLYGATTAGGSADYGEVFKLTPPAAGKKAWKTTVLTSFNATNGNGIIPNGSLIADRAGNLYGTTLQGGGTNQAGTVFELTPPAAGKKAWTITNLFSFNVTGGRGPNAGLIFDSAGNLYGTTQVGGADNDGVAFELTPPAAGQTAWTETVLYSFAGGGDGGNPAAGLIADSAGNLYGTTIEGGSTACNSGCGTVFELKPPAAGKKAWTSTVISSFAGANGAYPYAGLIADSAGNLYGTTSGGGASNLGTVFELIRPAAGKKTWTTTVLTSFNGTNGASPEASLIADSAGNLYGTAQYDGASKACSGGGCGAVFELTPPAAGQTAWTTTLLASFSLKDGAYPTDSLIADSAGNLYGTSYYGGISKNCTLNAIPGCGTVFKLIP